MYFKCWENAHNTRFNKSSIEYTGFRSLIKEDILKARCFRNIRTIN